MTHLDTALQNLRAEAVVIGTVVGDHLTLACRGSLAGEPVSARTVFYGASVTKQFVGLAAARAVSAGSISPQDPITRWLPELPAAMDAVGLEHLVHHVSGLPDLCDPALGVPTSNAEVIERFRGTHWLSATPGHRFAYNNAGYVLLAEALARATHQPAERVLGDLVAPLGLSDTRFGGPARRLAGHDDPPGTVGDGGLWTSLRDLMAWLQACNESAFGAESRQRAETGATLLDRTPVSYAWGVRVTRTAVGRVVTHGGSWRPWLAKTVRIPDRHIAVGILSTGADEDDVSRAGTTLAVTLAEQGGDA